MTDTPPRQLITTLYGLYARDEHNWLSVASLVRLMADLGVDAAAVRSSVSRLKKRGILQSHKLDGGAGYALAPEALEILREGDTRIFERSRATVDDGWLVVMFSVPESEREKRHALRSRLIRLGFGTAAPGVWVAPGTLYDETSAVLERSGLAEYVEFFRGEYLGDAGSRIGAWWDLDELEGLYAEFHDSFADIRDTWSKRPGTPEQAFAWYVPMLTAWRRLPYLDPGLPLEHLPRRWKGIAAGHLFDDLDTLLRRPADEHARAVLGQTVR